jgi:hypothetical protein
MLGTCVPNLRGGMEHSQIHLEMKKGKKNSIILAIFEEFLVNLLFHHTKISLMDMKVLVYSNFSPKKMEKNEISKLHEEWNISPSQV